MYNRIIESIVLKHMENRRCLTLVGPRQSGKTTLCKKLFPQYEYYSFESPDIRDQFYFDSRGFLLNIKKNAIFDEVQKVPELLSYLQEILDDPDDARKFILTGSNNLRLSNKVSQTLAGRTRILQLLPLQRDEITRDDQKLKMESLSADSQWEIAEQGPLQVRLKNSFKTGMESSIEQHMVLHRDSLQIDFETLVDWKENHKLLKAEFDLNIQVDRARHEIQYGHLERDTHDNLPQDRARFEVCNHQWSDLSEPNFGVALFNDCKYGISCDGSNMRLSLLKSGTHPDPSADRGVHSFTYSLLPHHCGFSTAEVIRPARELNTDLTVLKTYDMSPVLPSLFWINKNNILLESIKRAEDGNGYILRLFETEKSQTKCTLTFKRDLLRVEGCNMLEDYTGDIELNEDNTIELKFHGFEIKTLRIRFDER